MVTLRVIQIADAERGKKQPKVGAPPALVARCAGPSFNQ